MSTENGKSRHTARGIVVRGDQILFMERWRGNHHYYSVPGGGIEISETPEQTVEREIPEESTVRVKVGRKVLEMHDGKRRHYIFLCDYISGEPHLPPEAPENHHGPDNLFKPGWQPMASLASLPLKYWEPLKQPIIDGLERGFPEEVQIVYPSLSV